VTNALLAASAFAICYLLCWPLLGLLVRIGSFDRPNERSSHTQPTPRGGGLAVLAGIYLPGIWLAIRASSVPLAVILAASMPLAAISMRDDLRHVPQSVRFGFHLAAALVVLAALGIDDWQLALAPGYGWRLPAVLSGVLGVLWLAGYANAFNFMDGVNGIAGGQAALSALGMGLLAGAATGQWGALPVQSCFVVFGASAGFLPHNFPRPRMFMGDVGSVPMGLLLAALALWLANELGWWLLFPLTMMQANFVLDTGINLILRVWRREEWRAPHRQHFYQRLLRAGRTHVFVTCWEMGLLVVSMGLLFLYVAVSAPAARLALAAAVTVMWLGFFAYAVRAFRRAGAPPA
jgi:UDP-N-acetylmuramyl pentapeptide phosphotransferase/UDP-N-acetylglucosamine-1-phosphate transferase